LQDAELVKPASFPDPSEIYARDVVRCNVYSRTYSEKYKEMQYGKAIM
jgi:hypothetical protein